ncbi:hypothetical protein [Acinetobacter sp. ANC 5502]
MAVLAFLLLICMFLLNSKTGKLQQADAKCTAQIQKIEQVQQTALKQANDKANQASADYEQLKALSKSKQKRLEVKCKRSWRDLFIVTGIALTMTACSSLGKQSILVKPNYPVNLMTQCQNLTTPSDGTAKSILLWSVDTVDKYNDCKLKHSQLIEVVR